MKIKVLILVTAFTFAMANAQQTLTLGESLFNRPVNMNNYTLATMSVPMESQPLFNAMLFPVSLDMGNNFADYELYEQFFLGKNGEGVTLTKDDCQSLLDRLESGFAYLNSYITMTLFWGQYNLGKHGVVGLDISDQYCTAVKLPDDLFELGLEGYSQGDTFSFKEAQADAIFYRRIGLSYQRTLPGYKGWQSTTGLSLYRVSGFGHLSARGNDTGFSVGEKSVFIGRSNWIIRRAYTSALGLNELDAANPGQTIYPEIGAVNTTFFPEAAGGGWGMDLGLAVRKGRWAVALALTGIGSIQWNSNALETRSNGQFELTAVSDSTQLEAVQEAMTGETIILDRYSTALPMVFSVQATYQPLKKHPERLTLSLGLTRLSFGPASNENAWTTALFANGRVFKHWFWRSGFTRESIMGTRWHAGAGVTTKYVDAMIQSGSWVHLFRQSTMKRITLSLGLVFHTDSKKGDKR
ncbi:hypothetical protein KAR48_06270 [bacterium]|nr:hypothetical protein [bacterium]